jgi:hypothetical protein
MELFTLGEGHYGERDVKEAARAFTGWSLDRETRRVRLPAPLARQREKTVLGRTGRLDGAAVLDSCSSSRDRASSWREAVARVRLAHAGCREVRRLAAVFRDARYEVKPLLRAISLGCVLAPENRGDADQVAGRPGGGHPAHLRDPAAWTAPGAARVRLARAEPDVRRRT